jgi:hypothetical protein
MYDYVFKALDRWIVIQPQIAVYMQFESSWQACNRTTNQTRSFKEKK